MLEIRQLELQSETLPAIRDTQLPKLLSRKIAVENAERLLKDPM